MHQFNNQIFNLWQNYQNCVNLTLAQNHNIPYLWPTFYYDPPRNVEILFIGLNPSDSFPGVQQTIVQNINQNQIGNNSIFNNIVNHNMNFIDAINYNQYYQINDIKELEKLAFKYHNYFQKFRDLGDFVLNNNINGSYYHIDLYNFRIQDSKSFISIKNQNPIFFNKQLQISYNAISYLNPKIIFIANRLASDDFIGNFNLIWDAQKGCHILNANNLNCKVFLSGMITQSRAIDDYSFQRLKWHVKSIYDGKNMI